MSHSHTAMQQIKHVMCVCVQGKEGVIELLDLLKEELRLAMALSGKIHTQGTFMVETNTYYIKHFLRPPFVCLCVCRLSFCIRGEQVSGEESGIHLQDVRGESVA